MREFRKKPKNHVIIHPMPSAIMQSSAAKPGQGKRIVPWQFKMLFR
jgi:hypothetical protein